MPKKSSTRKKFKKKVSTVLIALAVIAATLMLLSGLFLRIELIRQNDINLALSDKLCDLQEKNKRLHIKYESSIDLNEIEDYAKNILGMQKPNKGQIREIDTGTQKTESAEDNGDISDKFEYWISCIFKS